MACSKCNKPCITVGGRCLIGIIRQETNWSFDKARSAILGECVLSTEEQMKVEEIKGRFKYQDPNHAAGAGI